MTRFPGLKSYRIAKLWKLSRVVSNLLVGPFAYSLRPFFNARDHRRLGEPSCQGIKKSQECHTLDVTDNARTAFDPLYLFQELYRRSFFFFATAEIGRERNSRARQTDIYCLKASVQNFCLEKCRGDCLKMTKNVSFR